MIYQTTILLTLAMAALLIFVPRKYFLLPFILTACFVPADQRIIIMALDFTPLRILVLVGFLKIFMEKSPITIKPNRLDKMVFTWAICGAVVYCLQQMQTQAIIYKCGVLFDVIGLYWIFRKNINSWDDIRLNLKFFAACSLIMAVLVAIERATGKNPFEILGAVQTIVREQRFRCQGSFPHSIMLGLFWGLLVPLFIGLAMTEKNKSYYWLCVVACVFIVAATASSTPILTLAVVIFALFGFQWRRVTPKAALLFLLMLCALHLVMKAPVWHLVSRVDIVGGSTGWHRYHIIDQAVKYFREWALVGTHTVEHWGWVNSDLTNQYILEGVRGGLVTLILFLVLLFYVFKAILTASLKDPEHKHRWLSWCFFVAMIGHCVAFFGVSYFGQITMLWYMTLAVAGFLAEPRLQPVPPQYSVFPVHPIDLSNI